jgi:hypothetical protein
MKFPRLAAWLHYHLILNVACQRLPDLVVGADNVDGAYLNRWFLSPWRRAQTRLRAKAETNPTWINRAAARCANLLPNLYLHEFLRDDDDRALHDHPSWAVSFILHGGYTEHTIAAGGIHQRRAMYAGHLRFLSTRHTHRIELMPSWWMENDFDKAWELHATVPGKRERCYTLFLFGPMVRDWGFHCPQRGWVHWKEFTAAGKPGEIGPGCDA